MRKGPLFVGVLLAVGVAGVWFAAVLRPPRVRSVVLVTIDTLRADRLGAYGRSPSITPELDRLAAEGVVFEACWTTSPLTVPAHASLLTGLVPPVHGMRTNDPAGRLPDDCATLAEAFSEAGFETAAFVSSSVLRKSRTGLDAGFHVYDEVDAPAAGALHDTERPGMDTVDAAVAWLRGKEKPVFVWVHLFDPHAPYDAPPPWGGGAREAASEKGYDGEVEYADHCIGQLLAGVRAAVDDPVIAVTSDHGEGLGEHGERTHGFLLHEATLHVPLIVSAPGAVAPGRRPEPASLVSVPATLLGLAGLTVPDAMAGRPLLGRRPDPDQTLYAETLYGWRAYRWAQAFALRRGSLKWITAGTWTRAVDLSADPQELEEAVIRESAGGPTENALATLSAFAAAPPLGATAAAHPEPTVAYVGAASSAATVTLGPEENALLPSPYDRIGDEAILARGRTLFATRAFDAALASFDEVISSHEGNPAAHQWRGKTLVRLTRAKEAVQAQLRAYELGYRDAGSVALVLQAYSLLDVDPKQTSGDGGAAARAGLKFLAEARGRGMRDEARTWLWEAWLHLALGDDAAVTQTLERADSAPGSENLSPAMRKLRQALGGQPK